MSSPNKSAAMQKAEVTTSSDTCIKPHVIRRFLEEMAEKHKVKIDRLNVHITDGTLYIQEYDAGRYETYKILEMHVLNGVVRIGLCSRLGI